MPAFPHVIWTDIELIPEAREELSQAGFTLFSKKEGTCDGIESADAVIAGSLLYGNTELFARAARLQVIARSGIGFDRIDVDAATSAGVCAVNTPDAPTESTATFAITLMLALARKLTTGTRWLEEGRWAAGQALTGFDLAGKTLGLVGCGRIGRRVAEIASVLGMRVQAFDPHLNSFPAGVKQVADWDKFVSTSDVLSLHLPASAETRQLIGTQTLASMRPSALLINTARGSLVDEQALLAALDNNRLAGAGLDVWDPEPPSRENPLLSHRRVVATPHMAAMTLEGRRRSHLSAVRQVIQVLRGEQPPHLLNPSVWVNRRGRLN